MQPGQTMMSRDNTITVANGEPLTLSRVAAAPVAISYHRPGGNEWFYISIDNGALNVTTNMPITDAAQTFFDELGSIFDCLVEDAARKLLTP